jgi:hypothetical protein
MGVIIAWVSAVGYYVSITSTHARKHTSPLVSAKAVIQFFSAFPLSDTRRAREKETRVDR